MSYAQDIIDALNGRCAQYEADCATLRSTLAERGEKIARLKNHNAAIEYALNCKTSEIYLDLRATIATLQAEIEREKAQTKIVLDSYADENQRFSNTIAALQEQLAQRQYDIRAQLAAMDEATACKATIVTLQAEIARFTERVRIQSEMLAEMDHDKAAIAERDKEIAGLKQHVEQLHAKLTCMCGSDVDHSGWDGHTPVPMYDYALDQSHATIAALQAQLASARELLQEARDHIGSMPTVGPDGRLRFFDTLKFVNKLEAALAASAGTLATNLS